MIGAKIGFLAQHSHSWLGSDETFTSYDWLLTLARVVHISLNVTQACWWLALQRSPQFPGSSNLARADGQEEKIPGGDAFL